MVKDYLGLRISDCRNCHKCIRYCPVKSISYESGHANVLHDECVLCGQCLINCPQHAKTIRDDVDKAKKLLKSGDPCYISLAPSFAAAFSGAALSEIERAFKELGFAGVEETAVGAAIVTRKYAAMVQEQKQRIIISSCCNSVNLMIQKYFPDVLPYLAKIVSPMLAHGADIKSRIDNAKTIFVGPCISKKAEADNCSGQIDCVLTFEEALDWFAEEKITVDSSKRDIDGRRSALYPLAGGIVEAMEGTENTDYTYVVIDGTDNCMAALHDIADGKIEGPCFIEMSACARGCIGGPAIGKDISPIGDAMRVRQRIGGGEYQSADPDDGKMKRDFPYIGVRRPRSGSTAIEATLRQMGKTRPEHELNCGSCGYETCREKAEAILLGKAEVSMCLPYLMEKAQSFSDAIIRNTPNGVIVFDRTLEIRSLNEAACKILNIHDAADVVGRQAVCILDPTHLVPVATEGKNIHDRRIWMAEYRRWVVMTAVLEKNNDIVICILRDVTKEENVRSEREELGLKAIEITDKVIENQMRTVQEIASLLGETTAATKVALTHLKESLEHE